MRRYLRVDNTVCHKEYLTMVNVFVDFYILLMECHTLSFFFLFVTCKEILLKFFFGKQCDKWKQWYISPSFFFKFSNRWGYWSTWSGSSLGNARLLDSASCVVTCLYVPLFVSFFQKHPRFVFLFSVHISHSGFVYSLRCRQWNSANHHVTPKWWMWLASTLQKEYLTFNSFKVKSGCTFHLLYAKWLPP